MIPCFRFIKKCQILGHCNLVKKCFSLFSVNEEVQRAIFEKQAVIALESTIITHGMKFPDNYNTAIEVENIIREQGAVPATIAVINGQINIGLTEEKIKMLSQNQEKCLKISRRDFPYAVSHKMSGGTTVSGTMIVAQKIGIPIFVTGGIGGVHRDGENTMDISCDLTELGRTPVAVISSGVKSILDIGRTLEYLETQGVAVATYGSSKQFPAFYCRRSSFDCHYQLKSIKEAAEFVQAVFDMQLNSGILIGVPIPGEYSFDEQSINYAIEEGLKDAIERNIKGKELTPFLLQKISELTNRKSLEAIIKNNALVGSKIAVELVKVRQNRSGNFPVFNFDSKYRESVKSKYEENHEEKNSKRKKEKISVVVIGGTNLDFVVSVTEQGFKPKAVFFTCIDSRMIPTRFTETCVGDMFVVRNAGNIIPHSRFYPDEVTTNEPAALELGCVVNNIRHIIVCGHSDCKAMNLLYSLRDKEYASLTNKRISPLRAWMCTHATSSLDRFLQMEEDGWDKPMVFHAETPLNKFVAYIDTEKKFRIEDRLSQVHTLQQLQNIASYNFLRNRLEQRDLHVHALWFDIYTGEIYYFSRRAKQFVQIDEDSIKELLIEVNTYYT